MSRTRRKWSEDYNNRRGLYRSRRGVILGVFRGLAEYLDVSIVWTRIIAVILLFFTGFWPMVGLYLLAALLMKPEPIVPFADDESREFYDSYMNSRSMALSRLKRIFDSLNKRLRRMEDIVTAKEFNWDNRFKKDTF